MGLKRNYSFNQILVLSLASNSNQREKSTRFILEVINFTRLDSSSALLCFFGLTEQSSDSSAAGQHLCLDAVLEDDVIGEQWEGVVGYRGFRMGLGVSVFDRDTSLERVSLPSLLH